ncbi:MAG: HigA family addiction module antidote protein [Rhodocyclales bacterium]|nr:HigA family addiction module antidote protein [Rhodocyclales bacterium]
MATIRDSKRRPTHPGAILREDVLPALNMTQTELAQRLGVSRLTVSEVLHEKRSVSADMALRLGKLLGNGPGVWLRMQQAVDLWDLERTKARDYAGIERVAA